MANENPLNCWEPRKGNQQQVLIILPQLQDTLIGGVIMEKRKIVNCKYPLLYDYYVTDDGRVWSEQSKKFMAQSNDKNGYRKVALRSADLPPKKCHLYSVHRLIMENFFPFDGMENYQVNHINGDKADNSLSNLEWVTGYENIQHAITTGLRAKVNGAAKLTTDQVIEIYQRAHNGERNVDLGREFDVHPDTIGKIRNKKCWQDLLKNY